MKYPKIYLTLDNCFALKRWTTPEQWMPLIKEIGFTSVQASFDNEIDMLYAPDWFVDRWFKQVEEQERITGLRVDSFYSGYQTYRTAGLGHADSDYADHLQHNWIGKAIKNLGKRKSHMGMSFYAIRNEVIQNPESYARDYENMIKRFSEVAKEAENAGIYFCVEAMYVPYQPPWTIKGTEKFLRDIYQLGGSPMYTTVDVGHMIGQRKFRKPSREQVKDSILNAKPGQHAPEFWIGADNTVDMWRYAVGHKENADFYADNIMADMNRFEYMFSTDPADDDPYAWLEKLGCYSPILHMQQTNGIKASHAPFTRTENEKGIIEGKKFLKALAKAYEQPDDPTMPPKTDEVYLAFELFFSNTAFGYDIVDQLKQTAEYWKQFVPEDGIRLDELLAKLG
ncbi:MAG: hypothetical protein ACOX71_04555 [Lachnospiraceae bacterium]|jgi:hypothetical protein